MCAFWDQISFAFANSLFQTVLWLELAGLLTTIDWEEGEAGLTKEMLYRCNYGWFLGCRDLLLRFSNCRTHPSLLKSWLARVFVVGWWRINISWICTRWILVLVTFFTICNLASLFPLKIFCNKIISIENIFCHYEKLTNIFFYIYSIILTYKWFVLCHVRF